MFRIHRGRPLLPDPRLHESGNIFEHERDRPSLRDPHFHESKNTFEYTKDRPSRRDPHFHKSGNTFEYPMDRPSRRDPHFHESGNTFEYPMDRPSRRDPHFHESKNTFEYTKDRPSRRDPHFHKSGNTFEYPMDRPSRCDPRFHKSGNTFEYPMDRLSRRDPHFHEPGNTFGSKGDLSSMCGDGLLAARYKSPCPRKDVDRPPVFRDAQCHPPGHMQHIRGHFSQAARHPFPVEAVGRSPQGFRVQPVPRLGFNRFTRSSTGSVRLQRQASWHGSVNSPRYDDRKPYASKSETSCLSGNERPNKRLKTSFDRNVNLKSIVQKSKDEPNARKGNCNLTTLSSQNGESTICADTKDSTQLLEGKEIPLHKTGGNSSKSLERNPDSPDSLSAKLEHPTSIPSTQNLEQNKEDYACKKEDGKSLDSIPLIKDAKANLNFGSTDREVDVQPEQATDEEHVQMNPNITSPVSADCRDSVLEVAAPLLPHIDPPLDNSRADSDVSECISGAGSEHQDFEMFCEPKRSVSVDNKSPQAKVLAAHETQNVTVNPALPNKDPSLSLIESNGDNCGTASNHGVLAAGLSSSNVISNASKPSDDVPVAANTPKLVSVPAVRDRGNIFSLFNYPALPSEPAADESIGGPVSLHTLTEAQHSACQRDAAMEEEPVGVVVRSAPSTRTQAEEEGGMTRQSLADAAPDSSSHSKDLPQTGEMQPENPLLKKADLHEQCPESLSSGETLESTPEDITYSASNLPASPRYERNLSQKSIPFSDSDESLLDDDLFSSIIGTSRNTEPGNLASASPSKAGGGSYTGLTSLDALLVDCIAADAEETKMRSMQDSLRNDLNTKSNDRVNEEREVDDADLTEDQMVTLRSLQLEEDQIQDVHPGKELFTHAACGCLFLQLLTPRDCGVVNLENPILALYQPDSLMDLLTSDVLSLAYDKLPCKEQVQDWLFLLMSVHKGYAEVHQCLDQLQSMLQRQMELLRQGQVQHTYAPSLSVVLRVLVNWGGSKESMLADIGVEENDQLRRQEYVAMAPRPNMADAARNVEPVVKMLSCWLQVRPSYSQTELNQLLLLVCRLALDHQACPESVLIEVQVCVASIVNCCEADQWHDSVPYLCQRLACLSDHHHNQVFVAELFSMCPRSRYLQQRLAYLLLHTALKAPALDQQKIQNFKLLDVLGEIGRLKRQLSESDRYLLSSLVRLLDLSVGPVSLHLHNRNLLHRVLEEVRLVVSEIRDSVHQMDYTKVKSKLLHLCLKWDLVVKSNQVKQRTIFSCFSRSVEIEQLKDRGTGTNDDEALTDSLPMFEAEGPTSSETNDEVASADTLPMNMEAEGQTRSETIDEEPVSDSSPMNEEEEERAISETNAEVTSTDSLPMAVETEGHALSETDNAMQGTAKEE